MSARFDDFLQEQLQDSEFRKEYESLRPGHAIIQAIIDARQQPGIKHGDEAQARACSHVNEF